MASQITLLMIVYSTVYSGTDQRKHQSSPSQAFVREIHRWLASKGEKVSIWWRLYTMCQGLPTIVHSCICNHQSDKYTSSQATCVSISQCWNAHSWLKWFHDSGIILCMHPANERWHHNVLKWFHDSGIILCKHPANERCNVISHWLSAFTKWSLMILVSSRSISCQLMFSPPFIDMV